MADPSLALTFDDLLIRVSESLGIAYYGAAGASAAATPSDTHDLDLVKRLVNDGWRRFVTSHPRGWEWMTPLIRLQGDPDGDTDRTVNDSSDGIPRAARYYMPDGFYGQVIGSFTFDTSGTGCQIDSTDEQSIRAWFTGGETTGSPTHFAVRPLPSIVSTDDTARKWEAIFYPAFDDDDYVYARVRIFPNKMVQTTDRHNAGFQFDRAVLAACLAEAEMQRDKAPGAMDMAWQSALRDAIAMDARTGQRRLGYNADHSDIPRFRSTRPYDGVSRYNGVSVTD